VAQSVKCQICHSCIGSLAVEALLYSNVGKSFAFLCLCHQAVLFGSDQRAAMPYSRKGNCGPDGK